MQLTQWQPSAGAECHKRALGPTCDTHHWISTSSLPVWPEVHHTQIEAVVKLWTADRWVEEGVIFWGKRREWEGRAGERGVELAELCQIKNVMSILLPWDRLLYSAQAKEPVWTWNAPQQSLLLYPQMFPSPKELSVAAQSPLDAAEAVSTLLLLWMISSPASHNSHIKFVAGLHFAFSSLNGSKK